MRQRGRKSADNLTVIPVNGKPSRIKPPKSLSEVEQTHFTELVASCDPEHFRESDTPQISFPLFPKGSIGRGLRHNRLDTQTERARHMLDLVAPTSGPPIRWRRRPSRKFSPSRAKRVVIKVMATLGKAKPIWRECLAEYLAAKSRHAFDYQLA